MIRAGRGTIESLKLGRYADPLGKHLIGATDGIDSRSQHWKTMVTFYGMVNEVDVDQHREKVDRGMSDAFRRLCPLWTDFRLQPGAIPQKSSGHRASGGRVETAPTP